MRRPANTCPKCGGVAYHIITDIDGKTYYQCHTYLTAFKRDGSRVAHFEPCGTVIDQRGKVFDGYIAYAMGNKIQTLLVKGGQLK